SLPPPSFFADWKFPSAPKENQLQVGMTGPGLVTLLNLALVNTPTLESAIPGFAFPDGIGLDARGKALLIKPQNRTEVEGTLALFANLLPNETLPPNPLVEV